jgi:8-oxo-dGTP pyrophosphatase MutT (NUDIX family)
MTDPRLAVPATSGRVDITVAASIEAEGRFLTVEEHAGGRIVFNQPAGHVEPGETLIEAVIRETYEESGYAFEPTAVLGIYHWHDEAENLTYLRIAFCGDARAPRETPVLDDVIVATHWLSRDQLVARQPRLRSPMVLRCVDDHLNGTRFPLACVAELNLDSQLRRVSR